MWESDPNVLATALASACAACGVLAVALVRTRRRWRATLGERGWLLEREREKAARDAVAAERGRIARELHDIVSHNVSVMVVQAGAAREVLATLPGEAAAALRAVEDTGRGALTDLRHLLGLLAPAADGSDGEDGEDAETREAHGPHGGHAAGARGADAGGVRDGHGYGDGGHDFGLGLGNDRDLGAAALAPQSGLDRLGALVDRVSFAGLPVEVTISGEVRPLPQGIDVTAYRIVQEALTNALKHGDGGRADVSVRYTDHALRVEVLTRGPSMLTGEGPVRSAGSGKPAKPGGPAASRPREQRGGTGRGLLGMSERVAVYGGDLDARRRLGGGFRVRARIPLDRPPRSAWDRP